MSANNVEIVRQAVELWSNGDLEGFVERVDPDIEWRTSGLFPDVDPVYYGHEGFRRFWRDFHETWETLTMEMQEAVTVGDQVAFSFHFDATGRDGVRTGRDQASVATLRNGLLLRILNFASWKEALESLESQRAR